MVPSVIKRIHLKNKQIETLTAPPNNQKGDHHFSLSPNNQHIGFIRSLDIDSSTVMLLDINSREIKEMPPDMSGIYSIAWTKDPNYLTFIDNTNTLYLSDIHSKKATPLYQHPEVITDHTFINSNTLVMSFGDLYKADIKQIDLNDPELNITPLISSTFKDHNADIYHSNDTNKVAFASNRSGIYQIWLKLQDELQQLTHFNDKDTYITEIKFSDNGEKILFKLNFQLFVLNIKNNKIIKIPHPTENIRNAVWSCNNENEIIVNAQSSGLWNAYKINVNSFETLKLIDSVTSIQSNCTNQHYIISKQNEQGLFSVNYEGKKIADKSYFANTMFINKNNWAVDGNKLYRLEPLSAKLTELDILTSQEKFFTLKNNDPFNLSVKESIFFFNDLVTDNTYIGKITIPNIENTMIK